MFLGIIQNTFAQTFSWGNVLSGSSSETITSSVTDAAGNVYVAGPFWSSTITLGTITLTNTNSSGSYADVYVAKYTPAGVISWAKSVGGTGDDYAMDIAVDGAGNVTVVGSFQGTADFNPSTTVNNLSTPNANNFDAYVLKLSSTGSYLWAKSFSGVDFDQAESVALDASGNVIVGGWFGASIDINPGPVVTTLTSAGFEEGFIAKLNSSGTFMWGKKYGGALSDQIKKISVDNAGNVAVVGRFMNASYVVENTVMKVNSAGVIQWSKVVDGWDCTLKDVKFDPWGNIFIAGDFIDSVDVDLGPGVNMYRNNTYTDDDIYLIKLNGAGNTLWAKRTTDITVVSPNTERLAGITVDAVGSVYVLGTNWGITGCVATQEILAGSSSVYGSFYTNNQSIFSFKYGKDGNYAGGFEWDSSSGNTGVGINVDGSGNLYVTGNFSFDFNIDPMGGSSMKFPYGSGDAFVAKLAPSCAVALVGAGFPICPSVPGGYAFGSPQSIGVENLGGMIYQWSPTNGLANPNAGVTVATPSVTTNYSLTVTNALTGCSVTSTSAVMVDVPTTPIPAYQAGMDKTVCLEDTIVVGNGALGTGFSCSYFSMDPNVQIYTTLMGDPHVPNGLANIYSNVAGTFPIYLDISLSAYGCYAKDTVMVTFLAQPTANAGPAKSICAGASTTIGSTSVPGNTYAWSPNTGLSATNVAMPTANPTSTTTYTLTVSNGTACVSTSSVTVTVNPVPVANAGVDKTKCGTTAVQIGTVGAAGLTYLWTPSTGLSSATVAQPNASPTATTTYNVKVTNAAGCFSQDAVVVTVAAIPTANAGLDQSICKGASAPIGSTAVAGNTYTWTPSASVAAPTAALTTANPSVTTNYTLKVTNAAGCFKTDDVRITVKANPIVNAGGDAATCAGTAIYIGSSAVSGQTYSWTPATGLSSATNAKPTANPTATTSYIVTASKAGCTAKDTVIVTVNALPTANAGIDKTICGGSATPIGTAGIANNDYTWSPITALSNAYIANPTAAPTANTTYTVSVIDLTTGCVKTDAAIFTVNPTPVANAGTDKWLTNCTAVTIGAAAVAGVTYSWAPSPSGLSNYAISNPTASPAGMSAGAVKTFVLYASKVYTGMTCTATDAMDLHANVACPSPATKSIETSEENNLNGTELMPAVNTVAINIYPNPVKETLNIMSEGSVSGNYTLTMLNSIGQVVYNRIIALNEEVFQTQIEMQNYTAGFYIVTLESNGVKVSKKIIKE